MLCFPIISAMHHINRGEHGLRISLIICDLYDDELHIVSQKHILNKLLQKSALQFGEWNRCAPKDDVQLYKSESLSICTGIVHCPIQ